MLVLVASGTSEASGWVPKLNAIKFIDDYHKRACCLKDKYSPGDGRLYLKPKFDVTSLIKS